MVLLSSGPCVTVRVDQRSSGELPVIGSSRAFGTAVARLERVATQFSVDRRYASKVLPRLNSRSGGRVSRSAYEIDGAYLSAYASW
jgi:hypothetical protein